MQKNGKLRAMLATGTAAIALLTGCASSGGYKAPTVSDQQVAQVQVPAGPVTTYNRTDDQNRVLLAQTFDKLKKAAAPICQQANMDCSNFTAEYTNHQQINAFASRGSHITVTSGLMKHTSEAELAAVVAHEMAHHIGRHNQNTQQRAQIGGAVGAVLFGLGGAALGIDPNKSAQIGAQLGQGTAVMSFSKAQEREADYVGAYILARAGYDLKSAGNVWNTLARMSGGGNRPSGMLATHPSSGERIVAWEQTIGEVQASPDKLPKRKANDAAPSR